MKRILTTPLSGAQPGVRRAYERLRQAIGGSAPSDDATASPTERTASPLPEPISLGAIPADLIELESRMLLRFVVADEPNATAIDASFELASRFTRHGATILDLQEVGDGVFVEFLLTVEQAMFILGNTPAAPTVLERWLRDGGYVEEVSDRIQVLTAKLRERYAAPSPTPEELLAYPIASAPTDPRDWN